jgi:molybdate transport system ATP-binding protein
VTLAVDVRAQFGDFRLDVAFETASPLTALFGPSGCGKTTLLRLIAGLARPDDGRIAAGGVTLTDRSARISVPAHRRRIGYVFQEPRLFPHLSVRQNLLYGRWFNPRSGAESLDRVVELLGLAALLGRQPGLLSGGERQRVALGRALLSAPRLLLMDEPLTGIDDARREEILPYIEKLRDEAGIPIVYVSHILAEVARLATEIVVMDRGLVAAAGPAAEMLTRLDLGLAHAADAAALIEAVVRLHDDRAGLSILETAAGMMRLPRLDAAIGARIRLWIEARDVILSTVRPENMSALNVFEARIADLRENEGARVEIRLYCGGVPLLARVTRLSVEALDLTIGRRVYAIVKSVAVDHA